MTSAKDLRDKLAGSRPHRRRSDTPQPQFEPKDDLVFLGAMRFEEKVEWYNRIIGRLTAERDKLLFNPPPES